MLVVWEPVIRTDIAPPTTGTLAQISDPRAVQYWDPDRLLSTQLVTAARANPGWVRPEDRDRLNNDGFVVWDTALVFPAGTRWDATVPQPSFYGGPVANETDAIRATLERRQPR